jgi:hypothetical protein
MDQGLREGTKHNYQQLVGGLTDGPWAAVEAMSLGRGGISLVAAAMCLSRTAIHAGT